MLQNKKGVFDILYLLIILFGIAVVGLIVLKISWEFTGEYQNMTEIQNSPYAKNVTQNWRNSLPYIQDSFVFLFFLGMVISLLVSAVRTQFSPVVIGLFILLLILTILVSSGLVNMYRGLADSDEMIGVSSKLTFTNIIFSRYTPMIIMILSSLILISMWGKSGSSLQGIG